MKFQEEDGYCYNKSKTHKIKSFFRKGNTKNETGIEIILKKKWLFSGQKISIQEKVTSSIYSLNKQYEISRALETTYDVSLNHKNIRIEDIRSYRSGIVHNTEK